MDLREFQRVYKEGTARLRHRLEEMGVEIDKVDVKDTNGIRHARDKGYELITVMEQAMVFAKGRDIIVFL